MNQYKSHRKRLRLALCLGLILVSVGAVLYITHDLVAPARRGVQLYHRSWLETPEEHGLRVRQGATTVGAMPYLVVEPLPMGVPGQRGARVRDQLAERQVELPPFGQMEQHLILLRGRKGNKEDMLPVAERYAAAGYRCLLPDLPGHGDNPASRACFGTDLDNLAALQSMAEQEEEKVEFTHSPAILGLSMGGSYAAQLAATGQVPLSAVVIISSFDQLGHVISEQCRPPVRELAPVGPPVAATLGWVLDRVWGLDPKQADSAAALQEVKTPLLVAHGTADQLIPLALGKRLYDASPALHKRWVPVADATHDTVLITAHPLYADTVEFLRAAVSPRPVK